ncbi:MAG: peptidylprolyl isomerase [Pseudomonadales bacterium]
MITSSSKIRLNFALSLEDGSEIDSNMDQTACEFTYGDGSLLPGFERALLGLSSGDKASITLTPENAFGEWQEDREHSFQKSALSEYDLEPGLVISFADPSGERPGVVKSVEADRVLIDFNHPLAGKVIQFDVHIHSVEANVAD